MIPENIVSTPFGWARQSEKPPQEKDMLWATPSGNIYSWDGDGWYRLEPPERAVHNRKELPHG